jgi:hypothetical protein
MKTKLFLGASASLAKVYRITCSTRATAMLLVAPMGGSKADTVVFTPDNVAFNDGGTATGSFTFDTATNRITNVQIVSSVLSYEPQFKLHDALHDLGQWMKRHMA